LDHRDLRDCREILDRKGPLGHRDRKVKQVILDLEVQQDPLDLQDRKATQEQLELQEQRDHKDHRVYGDLKVHKVNLVLVLNLVMWLLQLTTADGLPFQEEVPFNLFII
jgi:hypothetical protein